MRKYYFEQLMGAYHEKCMVKDNGTMIGSMKCQQCEHCKDYNKDPHGDTAWIKCDKLELALALNIEEQI